LPRSPLPALALANPARGALPEPSEHGHGKPSEVYGKQSNIKIYGIDIISPLKCSSAIHGLPVVKPVGS